MKFLEIKIFIIIESMFKIPKKNYIGFLKPRRKIVDKTGKYVERFEPSRKLLLAIAISTLGFGYYGFKKYTNFGKKTITVSKHDIN